MDYGKVIKRSLEVTWRNKALWLFGLLLALFGGANAARGGGGSGGSLPSGMSGMGEGFSSELEGIPWETLPFVKPWLRGVPPWHNMGIDWGAIAATVAAVVAVLAVVGLVMAIIRWVVRWLSHGALIGMVDEIETSGETTLGSGFRMGWKHLLKLFAINLLISIGMAIVVMVFLFAIFVIGAILAIPAVACFAAGDALIAVGVIFAIILGLVWLLLLIAGSIVLGAFGTLVREYALRACVLDGQGVFDAIGAAMRTLNAKRVESGLMWLLLGVIEFVLGLLLIPLVFAGILLGMAAGFAGWAVTEAVWGVMVSVLPILFVMGLVGLFLGALYLVFESTAWTLTYREVRGE